MANAHRRFKDGIYEQLSRIGKAVSAPTRIELLDLLGQGPRTVEALAEQTSSSIANTSKHLQVLRAARLVETEKKGLYVEYRLADAAVSGFFLSLRGLAETRLAEIERVTRDYFEQRGDMESVAGDDLIRRVRSGEVTILDVRPREEFAAGHIPRAICMPVDEIKARIKDLNKRGEIVAYCRGPYCVMAADAVTLLRKQGFKAQRMELGVAEWRARGWRVQAGAPGAAS
jgi:rhodanese-related sulfurtransferase/DNA-binding transcriptional ArsR family regulator